MLEVENPVKYKTFETEILLIKNEDIKEDLIRMINLLPDYFFEVGASSTGKYHPLFSQGEGGLVRHTKVAVKVAYELLNLEMYDSFTAREKDLIIYALLLHDGLKYGLQKEEFTLFNHPLLMGDFVIKNSNLKEKEFVSNMIRSHMGQWNISKDGNIILPKPQNEFEKLVHIADYLSSRKYLNIQFLSNEIQ